MAIFYEEKPPDSGGLKFIISMVETFLFLFLSSMFGLMKVAPSIWPIMIIPALIILLIMVIVAWIYLTMFGSSFIVTEEGIVFTELLFKKRLLGFGEISKVESAKPIQEGFQTSISFGRHGPGRYIVSSVKSESGETFKPDTQYSILSQHQAPDGVVLFFKDGKKMYISASDNVKLLSVLKSKVAN